MTIDMASNKVMFTSEKDCWETPQWLFDELNEEFHFTLDVAATEDNAKCPKFFTAAEDGLTRSWAGERVFCNPPYGRKVGEWVRKAYDERGSADIVMLIPARTDTSYFHEYIWGKAEVRFIRARVSFTLGGEEVGRAPFPSMVVVYR